MKRHILLSLTASAFIGVTAFAQTLVPFAQPAYYGGITGSGSNSAAFADVNADGHLDVVTVSGLPGGLSLLKGNGTGGFLAEVRINEGSAFYSGALQAFDYDSDGDTDVLTGEYDLDTAFGSASNGAVVIYLNNGSGVFTRQVLFGGLSSAASRVIAQDLNGDGRRDLLQMSNATTLVMLPRLVGGGFGTAGTISSGTNISSIWVADLNADGDNDIVAHDGTGNQMMFFANDGTALFAAPQVLAAPTFLSSLEVADFTGDGRVDVMVTYNAGTRQAQLYTQQPDTSFGAYAGFPSLGDQIYRVFLADVNKDSVPDLFSVSFSGNYRPRWSPGLGSGSYGAPQLIDTGLGFPTAFHVADLDGDTHQDVLLANATTAKSIAIYINKTGEDPMVLLPPASRSYVLNDSMELSLYFGLPVTVTGTPRVALQMGSNTVYANYVSGSGTPTLLFRYTVAATDVDLDGVQLASAAIDLNGGTLKNPNNGDAQLTFPNLTFSGVVVNGAGPLVQNITRLDPTPTNAPTVRFQVQFAEDVTGVDAADFELKQDAGDLDGGAVVSVTGSGSSYQVAATTGTGSGTLGLSVKGTATINDLAGDPLAKGFIGGQVYTFKRGAPVTIDAFFTDLHADYRPIWDNGEITFVMDADAGAVEASAVIIPSNEVLTYAAANSLFLRPTTANYDFLGVPVGSSVYRLPSSQAVGIPFLGMSGESVPTGTFARYLNTDPRVNATNAYMKIQMVAMRSSSGGHMSVYTISSGNPRVWMATSDGISSTDAFYQTPGSHTHRNVAFSAPGTYEVDIFVSGYRDSNGNTTYEPTVDPYIESGIFTMVFGVDFPGGPANVTLATDMTGSAPVAVTDTFTAPSGTVITGNVLTNDTDPQSQALTATLRTNAAQGTVSLASDGSFSYTLTTPDYEGSDSFTYWANDGNGGWSFATVNLTITPGNAMPSFAKGANQGHAPGTTGPQSFANWATSISDGDAGVEQALTFNVTVTSGAAIFSTTPAISSDGTLSYTLSGTSGIAQVSATLTDDATAGSAALTTAAQTFTITVARNAPVPFALPAYYGGEISTNVGSSSAADLNGDGMIDLVYGGASGTPLRWAPGTGDGGFLPERGITVGLNLGTNAVTTADYDGDGDIDVLSIDLDSASQGGTASNGMVSLYRNDGTGQFTRSLLISTGLKQQPRLAVGDLNNDGRPDIVYGSTRPGSPLQQQDTFYALQLPSGDVGTPTKLADYLMELQIADVNGDGNADIVGGRFRTDFAYSIHFGDGTGNFATPQIITTGGAVGVFAVTDVTGDGWPDIVSTDTASGLRSLALYRQNADGTFAARAALPQNFTTAGTPPIRVADINQDGIPDLVTYGATGSVTAAFWLPGLGGGAFGPPVYLFPGAGGAAPVSRGLHVSDLDGDTYPDIVAVGPTSSSVPKPIAVFLNKTGEDPRVVSPPAARTRLAGELIEFKIYFGFPIAVTGTPRIALDLNGSTIYASYQSGTGTPTLTFRYTVGSNDLDLDGVQLAGTTIDLNGGTMTNPAGGAAALSFPATPFTGVFVNAFGPLVQSVTRLDQRTTTAGTVRFSVQFSESVTNVDAADFVVRANDGDLAGATVQAVAGSGSLYEVTVSTGTGSGVLGLTVQGSSINGVSGASFSKTYVGGEVYTVRPQPIGTINTYYTHGHADYRPIYDNGEFDFVLHASPGVLPQTEYTSDQVVTYLDSTSIVNRGADASFDFLGVAAGEPLYLSNASGSIATVPYLGFSAESLGNVFTSSLTMQLLGVRSSSGGQFSLYSVGGAGGVTVRMATSDGITAADVLSLPVGAHGHYNTAFSKAGIYEVDIVASGYLDGNANGTYDASVDQYVESGIQTLVFHVDTLGARADSLYVVEGTTLTGNVTTNDPWHAGIGAFNASVVTPTTNGALTFNADGSFSYTPNSGVTGDSFVYRLTNPRGGFTTAAVTLEVSLSLATWRQLHFGTTANTGSAGDLADADHDGIPNLLEYAFDMNPSGSSTHQLPQGGMNGTFFEMSFTQPLGVTGISYGAEYSTTMAPTDWHPVPNSATPPLHLYRVPATGEQKVFMRIQVTTP